MPSEHLAQIGHQGSVNMKSTHSLAIIACLILTVTARGVSLNEQAISSAAYIVRPLGDGTSATGTGFFVTRSISSNASRIFLVSNKHVLVPTPPPVEATNNFTSASVFLTLEKEGNSSVTNINVALRMTNGTELFKGHPNEKVDVAVLDVTSYIVSNQGSIREGLRVGVVPENNFADRTTIKENMVAIGDRVVILGYPINIIEGHNTLPIARGGTLATPPEKDFQGRPVFLVDSATIRGSSGSPVFVPTNPIKPVLNALGQITFDPMKNTSPALLGIVAETVNDWELVLKKNSNVGPAETLSVVAIANFGIVFRAETISQTIDQTGVKRFVASP